MVSHPELGLDPLIELDRESGFDSEPLRCGEQTVAAQQLPIHLISSITLLYFPSNLAKHKQTGIRAFL